MQITSMAVRRSNVPTNRVSRFKQVLAWISVLIISTILTTYHVAFIVMPRFDQYVDTYLPFIEHQRAAQVVLKDAINSATGTLFLGEAIRSFDERRYFLNFDTTANHAPKQNPPALSCDKWNVVTTIFAPSEGVKRAAKVPGWCTVIVADTKTPIDYMTQAGFLGMESVVHYLSVEDQQEWLNGERKGDGVTAVGNFLSAIPYRHFARKNIGYLYAIQHGARLLFDFDDDNLLPIDPTTGQVFPPLSDEKQLTGARMVVNGPIAFNHHPLMGATVTNSWARGFPLQYIQENATQGHIAFGDVTLDLMDSVGVLQFCANGNPDIDAIHRLVHPLPMTFENSVATDDVVGNSPVSTKGSLVVPSHTFAPYNAQATVHTYKALWALLLPFTVPGRVSDIWRGYFAEALFRDLGLSVTFLPPAIVQDRNEHHYLADMQAELDLYFKSGKLLDFLSGWDSPAQTIPERMEELWIDLYERGYIELNDVKVVQLWLAALVEINYEFPVKKQHRLDHTVLMGQFNYADSTEHILFWHQKWRQWFNRIVVRVPLDNTQKMELKRHGIDAVESRADKGYTSPMENLAATLQDYKNVDGVTGVLYAHDDMLINVTNFFDNFEFGTNHLMVTHRLPDTDRFISFYYHPDGTFSLPDNPKRIDKKSLLSIYDWFFMPRCVDGYERLFADPRSKFMLESDGSIGAISSAQADVLYVPTSLADDFSRSAQLMLDNDVFLECAMGKIVENLYRTSNAIVERKELCTSFEKGVRETDKMLEGCELPTSAIHPMKFSAGLPSWNRWFDWATTGQSKFVGRHSPTSVSIKVKN